MRDIITFLVSCLITGSLISQNCSGGGAAEALVLDLTGVNTAGSIGSSGNSKGTICFGSGNIMDIVAINWSDVEINPAGISWCSESGINLLGATGSMILLPGKNDQKGGPCNNPYTLEGEMDLGKTSNIITTDDAGCITWQGFETVDDNNGSLVDQTFSAGTLKLFGCPVGQILPIVLSYFSATEDGVSNLIQWETTEERNVDYMAVEFSLDGQHWNELEKVKPHLSNREINKYSVQHTFPPRITYYRLVNYDLNGEQQNHEVALVKRNDDLQALQILENPVREELIFGINPKVFSETITVQVFNALGSRVQQMQIKNMGQSMSVDLSAMTSGNYVLRVSDQTGKVESKQFIKI